MDARTTLSISDARARIFDIAESAQAPHKIYTLTEHGKPKVVLMSAEEFESWQETVEVLHEIPEIFSRIKEAKSKKNLIAFPVSTAPARGARKRTK